MAMLPIAALLLWLSRPPGLTVGNNREDGERRQCLNNLQRISRAFAQYAQDFDGKFPRGVDADDRYNRSLWRDNRSGGDFHLAAQQAPMLPDLLHPYLPDRTVWRCPADHGYTRSRLPGSGLSNVFPSSYAKYGLSYSYFTIHGFAGMRAVELDDPGHEVLLFDCDLWHSSGGRPTINVLFGDGHTQNLTADTFRRLN